MHLLTPSSIERSIRIVDTKTLLINDRSIISLLEEFMGYHEGDLSQLIKWDHIMSFVIRINSTNKYNVVIFTTTCHINDETDLLFQKSSNNLMEAVLITIIRFIQWYNLKK
jgi:hypothetical protein